MSSTWTRNRSRIWSLNLSEAGTEPEISKMGNPKWQSRVVAGLHKEDEI